LDLTYMSMGCTNNYGAICESSFCGEGEFFVFMCEGSGPVVMKKKPPN
jgi:hypothetical protein